VQVRTLEPDHGKRHRFAHFSVLARFKGGGGALAVDYGGSPADGRGTESSVLNGGVVEGWLAAGINQQTSPYGAYRDCAVELHWRWAGFPTGPDA
jgi:hypothetical protein